MDMQVLDWLLEETEPCVRHRCLRELLRESGASAQKAQDMAFESIQIKRLLSRTDAFLATIQDGGSLGALLPYLTAWAEVGLGRMLECGPLIHRTYALLEERREQSGGLIFGCTEALALRALLRLEPELTPTLQALIRAFEASIQPDGGFTCENLLRKRPGRKSCYKASLAGLYMVAACIQRGYVCPAREGLLAYFLKRDVFFASDCKTLLLDGREGWRGVDQFFPAEPMRMGLATTLDALSILGAGNAPELERGWSFAEKKRLTNGRYILEGTWSKLPYAFGKAGQENKWVTLYMLLAMEHRKA